MFENIKFDFDEIIDRRDKNFLKWNVKKNKLPMWVADMDFKSSPSIIEGIKKKAEDGIFGYGDICDEWYDAYIKWWKKRHDVNIKKEWLIFSNGVIPSISSIIRRLSLPGENILLQTPVYNIFFNFILNNGRNVIENKLIYKENNYLIDWDDLEKKLKDKQTVMMILCNPHNPIGKIWAEKDVIKIGELCEKYNVILLSDEIHCDLVDLDCKYNSVMKLKNIFKKIGVALISPTKAFNIAGLQTSAVVVENDFLRHKIWRGLNTDEVAEPNIFAVDAVINAFDLVSEKWLDSVRKYIFENKKIVGEFIKNEIAEIDLIESPATYLIWLDCKKVLCARNKNNNLCEFIRNTSGLCLSDGKIFRGNGENFLRMNIACPKKILLDGLNRLKKSIFEYMA